MIVTLLYYYIWDKQIHHLIGQISDYPKHIITLYHTIAENETSSGIIPIFIEQFIDLFQMDDADNISFAESITISAMTASTPYSGSPIFVVMDMALTAAEDDAAALVVAADTVVADTVVADTVVAEITLVSTF